MFALRATVCLELNTRGKDDKMCKSILIFSQLYICIFKMIIVWRDYGIYMQLLQYLIIIKSKTSCNYWIWFAQIPNFCYFYWKYNESYEIWDRDILITMDLVIMS